MGANFGEFNIITHLTKQILQIGTFIMYLVLNEVFLGEETGKLMIISPSFPHQVSLNMLVTIMYYAKCLMII